MATTEWYSPTSGVDLEQGDLLQAFHVYRVQFTQGDEAEVLRETHDVVVLTQTCDLENDKVDDVLLARVATYDSLAAREQGIIRSKEWRKAAVDGNLPAYFLLPARTTSPSLNWSIVDFHNLFTAPKTMVIDSAPIRAQRLRLVSPYKEHLAQAFARYIMRVGLPTTLHGFHTYAPAPAPA